METIILGICGGSASGKTSVCRKVQEALGLDCTVLEMDNFYRGLTPEERPNVADYNFDHPNAIDFEEIFLAIKTLANGNDAEIPIYDFKTHSRTSNKKIIKANKLILYEGIYSLYDPRVREMMKLKIFVQTDDDSRLCRRLKRDTIERGRSVEGVLQQYFRFVKPSYDEFILPTMKYADIIIPHGAYNQVAIDLIVLNLKNYLL